MEIKTFAKFIVLVFFLIGIILRSFSVQAAQAAIDNNIWWNGVFHYQDGIHMNPLFPDKDDRVTVLLRVNRDDLTAAKIRYWSGTEHFVDMVWDHNDDEYSYWKGAIPASTAQVYYKFMLIDGTDTDWYNSKGMSDEEPSAGDFTYFPINGTSAFKTPEWVKNAVFYQIFPERFYNRNLANDPPGTVPWGSKPTTKNFMGGDLQGIVNKLDYLNDGNPETLGDLGITAIYLNPIFESRTNHKYSTEDYENVDDNFGDNNLLSILITEAHNRGIKIILDGVFNHTGVAHPFFDDVVKRGEASPYYNYYDIYHWPIRWYDDLNDNNIKDHPDEIYFDHWSKTTNDEYLRTGDYDAWWGFAHLPNLITTNAKVRDYFINEAGAISVRWINFGVDGWRLDVANEIEDEFWRAFRTKVKEANPEAYIVGEYWGNAAKWLDGTMWDSTMNYLFRAAVQNFFAGIDDDGKDSQTTVNEFDSALYAIASDYPEPSYSTALNLLGSHDTWRFIDRCGGDWTKLRAAVIFQMTYTGVPMIYYGAENGMSQWPGAKKDPGDRAAMEWENYSNPKHEEINELYRKLIRIRLSHNVLRSPHIRTIYRHDADKVYGYARRSTDEAVIVVINNSSSPKEAIIKIHGLFPDGTDLIDALHGGTYEVMSGQLTVSNIGARDGVILAVSKVIDFSKIKINEFLPAPRQGKSEWIELYNKGPKAIDLSGCKLDDIVDGGTSPYQIPDGTIIDGNSYYLFTRKFGLNNSGDTVNFISPQGKIIDSYKYSSNPGSDKSIGRFPDGEDKWEIFSVPMPGRANEKEIIDYTKIKINEFLPAPSFFRREFVELYNTGTIAVDLSGCLIDDIIDGGGSPKKVPQAAKIEPQGFFLIKSYFKFNNNGDTVNFIDPEGKLIDSYKYTENPGRNKSIGRSPDGESIWGILLEPTPGTPNSGCENVFPTASFTYIPGKPKVSQTINFDASASYDSDGTIVEYKWDWESDGTYEATGEKAIHGYEKAGTYKITLRIIDSGGASNTIAKNVSVLEEISFYGTTNNFAQENIYFVMTDRFVNGNTENDHMDQGQDTGHPTWEIRMEGSNGQYANIGYMGGDFEGIYNNADYIEEMGFTSVWITPIVDNPDESFTGGQPCYFGAGIGSDGGKSGYHGYWGVNFYKVDEHLESAGFSFEQFCSKMKDKGLNIILDIVCNHGSPSYTMKPSDQPKFGELYNKSGTLVADHENLDPRDLDHNNPLHRFYNKGGGLAQLSDLDENNPDVLDYLAGAYLQWINRGAYTFRIDTIAWMPHFFWKTFADEIRENHSKFFMFGENFNDNAGTIAQHQKPENGRISVLDFPCKNAIKGVFGRNGSYSSLEGYLHLTDGTYTNPYELVTFYDNHDMPRINADENGFIDAHNWLFTTRGIPCIYYGSEKRFMAGKSEHQGNRNYYGAANIAEARTNSRIFKRLKKIADIRKNSPALQKGLQVNIKLGSNTASFYRVFQCDGINQTALALLNKGDSSANFSITEYMCNGTWVDVYSGDQYNVTDNNLSASVPSHDVKVLLFNEPVNNEGFISLLKTLMIGTGEKVAIEPNPAIAGENVKVTYRSIKEKEIECHWGKNNWSGTVTPQGDIPMTWNGEKFYYECVILVPTDATMLDMVFHNITDDSWDNNGGADWHFDVH